MSTTDLPEESKPARTTERTAPPAPRARAGKGSGPIQFIRDVRLEMKKVTWPTRSEVVSTTMVSVMAVGFFGLYLWGVDTVLGLFFNTLTSTLQEWLR